LNNLTIERTKDSPKITLDYEKGLIEIDGKSYPENGFNFYESILQWMKDYFNGNAKEVTIVNIKLTYYNSATSQILFSIFDIFNEAKNTKLNINWTYPAIEEGVKEDIQDYIDEFEDLDIKVSSY